MFNKEDSSVLKEAETIIGPSVKIKGDFVGQGSIVVEGEVEGSLKSTNKIHIKSNSRVVADINAMDAVIGGEVQGNIFIKGYLELTQTAKVNGDIVAAKISIAKGAIFNGKCTMQGGALVKTDDEEFENDKIS
jgi:cytoskeletal protein CcmA (bactofilin family)